MPRMSAWPKPIQDYIYEISYGAGAKDSGSDGLVHLLQIPSYLSKGRRLYPQDAAKDMSMAQIARSMKQTQLPF